MIFCGKIEVKKFIQVLPFNLIYSIKKAIKNFLFSYYSELFLVLLGFTLKLKLWAAITKHCIPVILIYNRNYDQLFGNYKIHVPGSRLSGPILVSLDLHVTFIFIVHSHIMKLFQSFSYDGSHVA